MIQQMSNALNVIARNSTVVLLLTLTSGLFTIAKFAVHHLDWNL